MNLSQNFKQIPKIYLVYSAIVAIILYLIYQINTREYFRAVEYFMGSTQPEILINIKDLKFNPNFISIPRETTVKWVNFDSRDHSVFESQHGLFHSDPLRTNESFKFTFNNAGIYQYHSQQFPETKGVIMVSD